MIAGSNTKINYYAFGMAIQGRKAIASTDYQYGFNGKRKENEIAGNGNDYDFGARIYDSRLGRWLSIDKLANKYPDLSPYSMSLNNPIYFKDKDGRLIVDSKGRPIYTEGGTEDVPTGVDGVYMKADVRYYYSNNGKKIKALVFKYAFTYEKEQKVKAYHNPKTGAWEEKIVEVPHEKQIKEELSENLKYDCHGYVLITSRTGEMVYVQSQQYYKNDRNMKNSYKNPAEYEFVTDNISNANGGDVAIFGDEDGISHSCILNADGKTFTSKEGDGKREGNQTLDQQQKSWGKLKGFYRKKADKQTKIESDNGKVTNEQAKEAISK